MVDGNINAKACLTARWVYCMVMQTRCGFRKPHSADVVTICMLLYIMDKSTTRCVSRVQFPFLVK